MNDNIPSTRTALRTLLTVMAVALGVVIYAYGWNTTEISLDEVEDPVRQSAVQRAMRELLSPDIFTRDRSDRTYDAQFRIGCPEGELPDGRVDVDGDAYLIFDPPCADTDAIITVQGFNFPAGAIARLNLVLDSGQRMPFKLAVSASPDAEVREESTFDVNGAGHFTVTLKVPKGRGLDDQLHPLAVQTLVPSGWPRLSKTTKTVIDKMVETIFLALMATTLALPISIALSFIAARNLMRQINIQLGIVLVGFVLLPVGGVLGARLIAPVGQWALTLGEDLWPGLIAIPASLAVFAAASFLFARLELAGPAARVRSIALNLLLVVVLIFILGASGGIGIWLGGELQTGLLGDLGNFVGTLGELIDLLIVALAAVGFAMWLSSLGATLVSRPLRYVKAPLSNVLGAVLGLLSGAILLGFTGYIGMQAVLLGLLTPVVAAVMGGQILVQLLEVIGILPTHEIKADRGVGERGARSVIFMIGVVITFVATALAVDLVRAVVDQRLPADTLMNLGLFKVEEYIGLSILIGAALGGVAGGLTGVDNDFPLGMTIYNTSRTILNTLRSIEPLIMGIVFVIWVGVGPFAGVLALTLHSIAALGKLYSEQVENIDAGPIEAIQSTGANRLQTIVYAVVPQIVPPYIAFTMYRWDINVRMSTIIGFVGGGGIGFLLQQQINLLRYKQAGVAVLAIAIVVSVLDYASAWIREKIV